MELVAQIAIAVASPFCGSLFAASVSKDLLGGRLVWVVLCGLSCFVPFLAFKFEELPSWMDQR
jgi:hypothetical protein